MANQAWPEVLWPLECVKVGEPVLMFIAQRCQLSSSTGRPGPLGADELGPGLRSG